MTPRGNWLTQNFTLPQLLDFLLKILTIKAFLCPTIIFHLSFSILNSLRPLSHTYDFFVKELLPLKTGELPGRHPFLLH